MGPLALAGALAALPSSAQVDSREGIALQNQIYELRQQIQALQQQRSAPPASDGGSFLGFGGGSRPPPATAPAAPPSELVASLLDRVQSLEEQVRLLRGRVDQLENSSQRQYQDLSKQIGDLNFRLGGAGPGAAPGAAPAPGQTLAPPAGNLASPGSAPPGAAPGPGQAAPPRTPERAIQEGQAALARHDYATAEADAREVLQTSRTSPRAYDAQFMLAEALSGKRDFAQAAIAYDDAYNRSPKGARAADSLVGLANALANINEKKASCETLAKFGREFPAARRDTKDAAASIAARAGCH